MAQFLTTSGIQTEIEEIIARAKSNVVLISPYLRLSKTLLERLKDADDKKVKINIIYGKDELKEEEKAKLSELQNLKLFYFDNLHAKCYFNESLMIITSMNLYHSKEEVNREMGVLVARERDPELFKSAVAEANSIINHSQKEFAKRTTNNSVIREPRGQWPVNSQHGFCIRCGGKIKYDTEKPYCKDCYSVWADFENPDYEEQFCHKCGAEYGSATMEKPLCRHCYVATQK